MAVTQAWIGDIAEIIGVMRRFSDKYGRWQLREETLYGLIQKAIHSGCTFVSRDERGDMDGAIVGIVAPHPIQLCTVQSELGLFSEGRNGIRLFEAFVQAGMNNPDVDEILMTTLAENPKVEKLVMRAGFEEAETAWRITK